MLKRIIFILFAALLLTLPCAAAEPPETTVLDESELDALLAPYVEKYSLTEENFGLAFLYTGTNESYFINGDSYFYAASLFKVPLCMLVAEKVSSGELTQDSLFSDVPVGIIEERCIIASNNGVAANIYSAFGDEADELLVSYSGIDYASIPETGYKHNYSARLMLNTLQTLYEAPERFPNIIECMLQTQPGNYFRETLEGRYDVAQKYGQYGGALNNAGIIYTPTPIILVVMTNHLNEGMELIADMAGLFADYSLTLDERLRVREEERLAAEETARQHIAAEEAERQRIAAEEAAARAERDRLVAEEAVQMEEARLVEQARLAAAQRQRTGIAIITGSSIILLLSILLVYVIKKR